jgi:branched-chain amino acid transport system permease protein
MIAALARPRRPLAIGAAILVAWPMVFSSSYDLRVFTLAGIYAIMVIGYQFIFGHAGALALTQGAFFGLAAYITAILGTKLGWASAATLPLSIIGPVLLAALVAVPVLRLETHYFALATLGIAQVTLLIAIRWENLTGGANGLAGVPGLELFGIAVPRGLPMVVVVWSLVAVCGAIAWGMLRGLYGRAFHVMRTSEMVAGTLGLDTGRLRFAALLLSAAFAGLAGALHAHMVQVVSPDVLEFHVMIACLSMAVVGGRTRVAGAVLGAVLLVHLPEWFRGLEAYYLIAYGVALLAMIIAAPDGLGGLLEKFLLRTTDGGLPIVSAPQPVRSPPASPRKTKPGALLAVERLSKRFGGVEALGDVTFNVNAGEILGLIGPNGSGKTTLINIVTGLHPADRGAVRLAGAEILGRRPFEIARLGIARTFQGINLVDDMSALDNVAVARMSRDSGLEAARASASRALLQVGIEAVASRPAGALPQGIKRRLEIARALALEPDLLLLDEPAAGLNAVEQNSLADLLQVLARGGVTLVVIEHNMPFLMPLAHRIVCLDAGRMIAEGTPTQIRSDPAVIAAYLGAADIDRRGR